MNKTAFHSNQQLSDVLYCVLPPERNEIDDDNNERSKYCSPNRRVNNKKDNTRTTTRKTIQKSCKSRIFSNTKQQNQGHRSDGAKQYGSLLSQKNIKKKKTRTITTRNIQKGYKARIFPNTEQHLKDTGVIVLSNMVLSYHKRTTRRTTQE